MVWGMNDVLFGRCCGPCGLYDHEDRSCTLQVERPILTSVTGGTGLLLELCSQGSWANCCCTTLFLFTVI